MESNRASCVLTWNGLHAFLLSMLGPRDLHQTAAASAPTKVNTDGFSRARGVLRVRPGLVCLVGIGALVLTACAHTPLDTTISSPSAAAVPTVTSGGSAKVTPPSALTSPYPAAVITFTSDVTFIQAQRVVTDLGLQPVWMCDVLIGGTAWRHVGQSRGFGQNHELGALPTPDAAPDWIKRLSAMQSVAAIYSGPVGCPNPGNQTPTTGAGYFLTGNYLTYAGASIQVVFAGTTLYDQALSHVSDLGFRLANPCFEQAKRVSSQVQWEPQGQDQAFGVSHALLLATTTANSSVWQTQLHQESGVIRFQSNYQPSCSTTGS